MNDRHKYELSKPLENAFTGFDKKYHEEVTLDSITGSALLTVEPFENGIDGTSLRSRSTPEDPSA
jgi:hypothetical protein